MAVPSHTEPEETGEAVSGARPTYFPAAAAYRTSAAAAGRGAARSSDHVRHSGHNGHNGHDWHNWHNRQPQLDLSRSGSQHLLRFVRDPGFNLSGGKS